jgi:hypothetical protein
LELVPGGIADARFPLNNELLKSCLTFTLLSDIALSEKEEQEAMLSETKRQTRKNSVPTPVSTPKTVKKSSSVTPHTPKTPVPAAKKVGTGAPVVTKKK